MIINQWLSTPAFQAWICVTSSQIPRTSFPVRDTGSDPRWGCLGLGTRVRWVGIIVFPQSNTVATIYFSMWFTVATIWGWPLFKGGIYYTQHELVKSPSFSPHFSVCTFTLTACKRSTVPVMVVHVTQITSEATIQWQCFFRSALQVKGGHTQGWHLIVEYGIQMR